MLNGLNHVTRAAVALVEGDALLRDRLKEASAEFFVAMAQPDEWPAALREAAKSLDARLQQLKMMDQRAMKQAAYDILDLCMRVDAEFRVNDG
jgi:hypothetical protein